MLSTSLRYDFLSPDQPMGILILIIGALFTGLVFLVFYNVNQDKDSIADKRRKKTQKLQQAQRIAKLYPQDK